MVEDAINKNDEVIAEWSVHRIRQDRRKLNAFVILVAIANVFLYFLYREIYMAHPFFAVLGNIIIIGAMSDYLFPLRFRLTMEGAEYRNLLLKKRIVWQDVRNCYLSDEGIKLSPLTRRCRLENFRGLTLFFNNNKDEIIEHVKRLAINRIR